MPRLVRVRPGKDAGYRRLRAGNCFRYVDERGRSASDADRDRIRALVIPPAWRDVWIAREPLAHIQAVGTDEAGRRQYLYHPQWRTRRDRGKFARALRLAVVLPRARRRVTIALRREAIDRERVLAVAFRLLDSAAPRIGSSRYLARHGSRGLTTLRRRDAVVEGSTITFSFPAKSGKRAFIELEDAELAAAISTLVRGRGSAPLLAYQDGRRRVALRSRDVNGYVRELTGGPFTAKDFRTLRGTILAAETLARTGLSATKRDRAHAEVLAVRTAAEVLGNTPAVARGSYIDPRVFARYRAGEVLDLAVSPETAIRALLGDRSRRRRGR